MSILDNYLTNIKQKMPIFLKAFFIYLLDFNLRVTNQQ